MELLPLVLAFFLTAQSIVTDVWGEGLSNGQKCRYQSHYSKNAFHLDTTPCDFTVLTSAACSDGWFGPCCQYRDLAYNRTSGPLTDNNSSTCLMGTENSVTISLSRHAYITWMRLYGNDTTQMQTVDVQFTGHQNVSCTIHIVSDHEVDIYCEINETVKEVILSGEGVRSLCSVHISGGRSYVMKTDGDIAGSCGNGITYTASFDYGVRLYRYELKRNKAEENDINWKMTVKAGGEENTTNITGNWEGSNFLTAGSTKKIDVIFPTNEPSRPIVELSIDPVCDKGYYGSDCKEKCNCKNESCYVWSGICLSGCPNGYFGMGCKQECKASTCGKGCLLSCPPDCIDQLCDSRNCNCTKGRRKPMTTTTTTESTTILETHSKEIGLQTNVMTPRDSTRTEDLNESHSNDENDAKPFAIAAITLTCCGAIIVVTICLILYVWRRRKNAKTGDNEEAISMLDMSGTTRGQGWNEDTPTRQHYSVLISGYSDVHTSIKIKELGYFLASKNRDFFESQFKKIPTDHLAPTSVGQKKENINKHRYKNICTYDHSRVHLQIDPSVGHGDYINASYVRGYKNKEQFIAAQGPTPATVYDFLRMLWEQKVEKVVMLANLVEEEKKKSERYWPEESEQDFGDIKVKLISQEHFADYTIRKLKLVKTGYPAQKVTHYHFTSWPDKDVPRSPWGLVDFEQRVAAVPTIKPIVVHCSAGVGRTGTFIVLCHAMCEAKDTGYIDFYATVMKLRQDRILMVQTLDQYIFVHKAAEVAMLCMRTTIASSEITDRIRKLEKNKDSEQTEMEQEFQAVCSISAYSHLSSKEWQHKRSNFCKGKDRFEDIVPENQDRPYLCNGRSEEDGYINAVFVPSFTRRNQDIITQLPLPNTVGDFWKLIVQYSVSLIVALETHSMSKDPTTGDYLQEDNQNADRTLKIKFGPPCPYNQCVVQTVDIIQRVEYQQSHHQEQIQIIKHQVVHMKCNMDNLSPQKLLAIVKHVQSENISDSGRILYMCRNGAYHSGLVCVLSLLIERLQKDRFLTIPLTVGAIKAIRPQVIPTVDQYRMLYKAILIKKSAKRVRWEREEAEPTSDFQNYSEEAREEPSELQDVEDENRNLFKDDCLVNCE